MNNATIIANEAVASGFFTEEQIDELISEGQDIPFHTYSIWKKYFGMVPKKGSHGWECKLWRKKDRKSDVKEDDISEEERKRDFYLTKSFLFHSSQVETIADQSP